jgi:hypothetical protein
MAGSDITWSCGKSANEFTVQSEAVPPAFEPVPLPTDYWTRPINAENRHGLRLQVTGCLQAGANTMRAIPALNPYSEAPSRHTYCGIRKWHKRLKRGATGRLILTRRRGTSDCCWARIYVSEGSIHCVDVKTEKNTGLLQAVEAW